LERGKVEWGGTKEVEKVMGMEEGEWGSFKRGKTRKGMFRRKIQETGKWELLGE
jgi:hypothetical protein